MIERILNLVSPPVCTICGFLSDQTTDLCRACENDLPWLTTVCDRCALPLMTEKEMVCGQCLQQEPPFTKIIALFDYQQPIVHMVTSLKFHQKLVFSKLLGQLLLKKLQTFYENKPWPECIIPVPPHKKRIQERGFNQAIEIAKPIHHFTKIPFNTKDRERILATQAQTELPAKLRQANVKNAFHIKKKPANHIAIIDDVITTGHTIHELGLQFKKSGVERIDVWCCARTALK